MSDENSSCCMNQASTVLKLYQVFIFSVPILFTSVLLLLFYLCYLRRRRVEWSALGLRSSAQEINLVEFGLKRELRELLPVIVYNESFCVKDTQCSVCLSDYQADDRLQQIPECGHSFHMECIDHWLTKHTTCPLCRLSLHMPSKSAKELPVREPDVVPDVVASYLNPEENNNINRIHEEPQNVRQVSAS